MKTESQLTKIRKHLKSGKSITPLQALRLYGCLRLAARVNDLKSEGLPIKTKMVYDAAPAYKYASYSL